MLNARDMFEAVAFQLYDIYGSVAFEVTLNMTATAAEKSVLKRTEELAAASSWEGSSPKCSYVENGEETVQKSPWRSDAVAARAALESFSPGPSPSKRYRCKNPELQEEVKCGGVMEKQPDPRPIAVKRNAKLCQAASCMHSTGQPGQPARAEGTALCMWCDPAAMKVELGTKKGRSKIAKSLTPFSTHARVHSAALTLLPDSFSTGRSYYCRSPDCIFNERRPGHPARLSVGGASLCLWCDPKQLQANCATDARVVWICAHVSV